jgi:ribonucleotide reductase beta subunit family protein with ferritin-like domain
VTSVASHTEELRSLEERPPPYPALYDHWERNQWAVSSLDFSTDAESFAALGERDQRAMAWLFAHRFHAEFNVATLLTPFLDAAPFYELELLLATQIADEYKHLQCVLRIYREVFGVTGGIEAVREFAEARKDPASQFLYEALEQKVLALRHDRSEDAFLKAVFAYHIVAEGVVASVANRLVGSKYGELGFPGLAAGQRRVALDEARHIGIGVAYVRERMQLDREATASALDDVLAETAIIFDRVLELGKASVEDVLEAGYGVDAERFGAEVLRTLEARLRSIGYLTEAGAPA